MPDKPNTPTPPVDAAKHNAEIAQQVKDQDISGKSTVTGEFGEASSALDQLAAKVTPKTQTPPPEGGKKGDAPPPEAGKKVDAPPLEGGKKMDAPPPEGGKKADAPPPPPEPSAEDAAHLKKAEDLFKGAPSLPPNASPKSAEAFAAIKLRAAQELSAREQKIEELNKKLDEAKNPSAEQLQRDKELDDLRQWRAKLDVDFDPKFKEFDQGIAKQREFVYAQLAKSPSVTPEVIEQIKKYGGPDMIKLDKLFASINDPTLQRLVEAKVADIEMAKYNRDQAVQAAKDNVGKYLEERKAAATQAEDAGRQATTSVLDGMLKRLDWFAEKTADSAADDVAKKEVEAHNKFVAEVKGHVAETLKDNSPEMRAILITGMAQLFRLQKIVPALEAKLASTQKSLEETQAKWESMKNASRSRLTESQAPAGGGLPQKTGVDLNQRPGDALDAIARDIAEKRNAAGV